ncbi:aspartate transaminase [Rhodococcus opacus]|uniref:aspartate transaminase n=1 Tax=Rhodococcus opacus TaxID=37919 RepID=UPI0002A4181C|nr:aspartate transaminase [Rhodococcus opacus]ELB90710.1 aspartate aminotransferase [Rhodococcus wratislaviensis IFP 2016]MDX5967782.1 aspartate transaminase [Rhodococcus opacus]NKY76019.1 aspartate transaminase [Rhodococcus opacus]CAG7587156.1 Aspartate aminotransferase [Rhodococcus opacus]
MSTFVPAARVDQMRESPSVAAAQRVRELRASGREILDLTVGEPDFDTPDHIKAAAVAAMESGLTKYTPVNGIPALREAISKRMLARTGVEFADNEITVGGGAKQVIFLALMATVEEGTEVIVPAPYWVSYPDMVTVHGGTPVVVDCPESDRFLLTAEKLAAAITPATKWVILNAPSNPTGSVYSEQELADLAAVLDRNPHVNVLCDEIYDEIVFTDSPLPNLLSAAPHLRDRILVTNGVSKAYAMTGWRLGYGVGNKGLIAAINKLQSQSSSCPSSISQAAAAEALTGDQSFVTTSVASYRARRDVVFELFSRIEGLEPILPQGAFYLFVGCSGLVGKRTPDGTLLENDQDVVLFLLDHASVATIQGSAYGAQAYFRVSFATSEDVLRNAVAAVEKAVASLS